MSELHATRRDFLKAMGVGVAAALPGALGQPSRPSDQPAADQPNILLIMADDLGVECLSAYGGRSYQTPHIDALAASGVRFEYCFATPLCTPSRVQLMTGRYPFRTGWYTGMEGRPEERRFVDPRLPSMARMLKGAGYATAVAGKWQLALFDQHPNHPKELGFDEHCLWTYRFAGGPEIVHPRFWKPSIWQDGRPRRDLWRDDVYGPDVFTEYLIDFITRRRDGPFFAYYPMVLTHAPYLATPDTVNDRESLVTDAPDKRKGSPARFGANVAYMDKLVGRLIATLDRLNLRNETVVIFTADNGTHPTISSTVGKREIAGGKHGMDDRGTSVPLIASAPGFGPAGRVCSDLTDFTDVLPTLAELGGAVLPEGVTFDGRSFAPQIRGEPGTPREWVCVQAHDKCFVRDRRWRLHEEGSLCDVRDRYAAKLVNASDRNPEAEAARERLGKVMARLRKEAPASVIP